jgi:ubiquinone/menaquinone biosynthesis C-methylase UbiE
MDKMTFFNELAGDWDQRFYTLEVKERLSELVSIFHLRPASRLLDVGGGTGGIVPYLLEAIGEEGSIWSVDFAEKMVEIGRKKFASEQRVAFKEASVEWEYFDHVVCFGAFPHFDNKEHALKEMNRVLKKEGTLIIAHALSSEEIKSHHKGASPVSQDFLPEKEEMKRMLENSGFHMARLIDKPKCYLCEGVKIMD